MIHLDTNYLIRVLVKGSPEAAHVDAWLGAGRSFSTSAVAWTEFLSGPINPAEVVSVEALLEARIIPFSRAEAVLASELFNKAGRRRGSRLDCLIAATAIIAKAQLATANEADFRPFVNHGLTLTTHTPS